MKGCLFCDDLEAAGTLIFDDGRCAVLLHPDASPPGHAMVVWRRHVENIADLQIVEREHFVRVHSAAERAVLSITAATRAILLKLGIQTPHLHLHVYPASAEDDRSAVMRMINGERGSPAPLDLPDRLRQAIRQQLL